MRAWRSKFFPGFAVLMVVTCVLALENRAAADAPNAIAYPLDAIPRVLDEGDALPCVTTGLITYRGKAMALSKPAHVHPAFAPKLEGLEALVIEVATEVYGRAPRKLVHLGTSNCRRMRQYPDWVSEHALANAIDVAGFDFGPLPKGAALPEGLPLSLRRAFSVRLDQHWN